MARFTATHLDEADPAAAYPGTCAADGVLATRRLSPPGFPLWLAVSELADGARLRWNAAHGDEAVCVLEGALEVGGRRCPAGGALVVESDAACEARALGPTVVAHYGPEAAEAPADGE